MPTMIPMWERSFRWLLANVIKLSTSETRKLNWRNQKQFVHPDQRSGNEWNARLRNEIGEEFHRPLYEKIDQLTQDYQLTFICFDRSSSTLYFGILNDPNHDSYPYLVCQIWEISGKFMSLMILFWLPVPLNFLFHEGRLQIIFIEPLNCFNSKYYDYH